MNGIAKKMPWTMASFSIATLSMIGVPPVSGFITKWYLIIGSLERGSMAVLIVLLVSSFLNAAYFIPILYRAYFKKENLEPIDHTQDENDPQKIKENLFLVIPLTVTALVSIILGVYPDFLVRIAKMVL